MARATLVAIGALIVAGSPERACRLVHQSKKNLFVPHRWKRALHLTIQESDLVRLPTQKDLANAP